jgi:DMSO/TMAO reductase YedYZ molybdopterin-dependent catalytic subunit
MTDFRGLGRRRLLAQVAGSVGALALAGCDRLSENPDFTRILDGAEAVSRFMQKTLTGRNALACEYVEADISADFRANGTTEPNDPDYQRLAESGFTDWRLAVGGLVARPRGFSLAELKQMPSRTQITRHDCVEGWSCIGKWKGVRLETLLDLVGPNPVARYIVFYCADAMNLSGDKYYESIDLDGTIICRPFWPMR